MGATGISSNISSSYKIDRTPFTDIGGGQWTIDIEGVGGASILDESDTMYSGIRTSAKVYSVKVWNKDYDTVGNTTMYGSLNAAKQAAKDNLRNML